MLGPGGAEARFPTAIGCGFEKLHLREQRRRGPHEDELGDPGSLLDEKRFPAVVVYEGDLDLPPVARVDKAGRVDEGDSMPHREPAARKHEPRKTLRNGDRDPGPHLRPSPRRKLHFLYRTQVVTGIPGMRPFRYGRPGNESAKRYVQREILAHPQNGSIGGIRLQRTTRCL